MSLSITSSELSEHLAKLPQQRIAKALIILLVIYLAYLFARLTWLVTPQQETALQVGVPAALSVGGNKTKNIDVKSIQALSLFGKYQSKNNKKAEQEVITQDAPETRLRLKLTGVVATNSKQTAAAIIENGGTQHTYGVGENIKGTRAVLADVFHDRVILRVSGRLETLMFEGLKFNKNIQPLAGTNSKSNEKPRQLKKDNVKVLDQRGNKSLTATTSSLKKEINTDPAKITDYLKISPKTVQGKIAGYQLLPGKDPTFFKKSGLKSGDVAIQMNGFDLTQPKEAAQALRSLKELQEISLLLDRNGEVTEILFSIDN